MGALNESRCRLSAAIQRRQTGGLPNQPDVDIDSIQPGKPNQSACAERFSKTDRTEVLDGCVFDAPEKVRDPTLVGGRTMAATTGQTIS